jgi:DNA-binding XRE family transcriptional regulator
LRTHREKIFLTRAALATLCDRLAAHDSELYTAVSEHAIKKLEMEDSQPRASTAVTLAAALKAEVAEIFPFGIDTKNRRVDISAGK